jgi:DNA modification methylase
MSSNEAEHDGEGISAHGANAPEGSIVMIDPARVTRYSAVRPITPEDVEEVLRSIVRTCAFDRQYAVTGRFESEAGDVYIRDGAHRCMAILRGREQNLRGFRDMLVPMVVLVQERSDSCEAVLAVQSNENTAIHKKMTFPDYVTLLVRLRDTAHEGLKSDSVPLSARTWSSVVEWTLQQSAPEDRDRVKAFLNQKQLNIIYTIVQAVLSHPLKDAVTANPSPDLRAWEMFQLCTGREKPPENSSTRFPSVSDVFDRGASRNLAAVTATAAHGRKVTDRMDILSRRSLDCPFFRGHPKKLRAKASTPASFLTGERATPFEQVLFMSVIKELRATPRSEISRAPRPSKKQKTTHPYGSFQSADEAHGQRLGFAIRCIVDAWSRVATSLGYGGVEDMIGPYIIFDRGSAAYSAIATPLVWSPPAQASRLLHGDSLHDDPELLDPNAKSADVTMDAQLREAAKQFLQHVKKWATNGRLFGDSALAGSFAEEMTAFFGVPGISNADISPTLRRFIHTLPALATRLTNPAASPSSVSAAGPSSVAAQGPSSVAADEPSSVAAGEPSSVAADEPISASGAPFVTRAEKRGSGTVATAPINPATSSAALHGERASLNRSRTSARAITRNELETPLPENQVSVPARLQPVSEDEELETVSFSAGDSERLIAKYAASYNVCFRDVIETHELSCGENLVGKVQLVLTDPPYNTRSSRSLPNSSYDCLSSEDLQKAAELIVSLLRPGGHAIIFCSNEQHELWTSELQKNEEMMVDSMPFAFVRAPGAFYQLPKRKTTTLMNMYEVAVHATKQGEGKEGHEMVSYRGFGHVPSRFKGWCNVIDNVPRLGKGEAVMTEDPLTEGQRQMRFEQKPEALMRELICRFSMPNDIVVDLFSGTYTTAVSCLTIPTGMYRRFVGCERDKTCHAAAQGRIRRAFAEQYCNGCFGQRKEEVRDFFLPFLAARPGVQSSEWTQPPEFPAFCCLPRHIMEFLCVLWGKKGLSIALGELPVDKWPAEYLDGLEEVCPKVLRAIDCAHFGVIVKPSSILSAGDGLFAARGIRKGDRVGWYNGTLVYRDLSGNDISNEKLYGPRFLWCSVGRFKKYGLQTASKKEGKPVFVVPHEFCSATMINDPRPGPGEQGTVSRKANVVFREADEERCTVVDPFFVEIIAQRDIVEDEELFIDYGPVFSGWSAP